jgi:hypothetical protein
MHPSLHPHPRPLPAQDLVELLKRPFCVGAAQRRFWTRWSSPTSARSTISGSSSSTPGSTTPNSTSSPRPSADRNRNSCPRWVARISVADSESGRCTSRGERYIWFRGRRNGKPRAIVGSSPAPFRSFPF